MNKISLQPIRLETTIFAERKASFVIPILWKNSRLASFLVFLLSSLENHLRLYGANITQYKMLVLSIVYWTFWSFLLKVVFEVLQTKPKKKNLWCL